MLDNKSKADTNVSNVKVGDDVVEQSLYQKRQKIYPREVHGLFAALRTLGVVSLLGFFISPPGYSGMGVRRCCLICRNVNSISSIWCSGRRISFILRCC